MRINIFESSRGRRINRKRIRKLIRHALQSDGQEFNTVNVVLTDGDYLRRLNREYFRKNRTTNVISFNLYDVAEIYISEGSARSTAEIYFFIMHGLLHTIGYDHRKRKDSSLMMRMCRRYLSNA